jgi:hypothetical protein
MGHHPSDSAGGPDLIGQLAFEEASDSAGGPDLIGQLAFEEASDST